MASLPKEPSQTFKDLLIFHKVASALTSSLELDSILRVILEQMEQFFQPETWSLLIVDDDRKDLYYAVAVGQPTANLHDIRVPMGEGIAGWVAAHGETLIVPEVSADPRFAAMPSPEVKGKPAFRIRSAICIPLRSRLRTLGVIQLFNCRLDTLTDYTISFLHVLCDYAAIAIENARAVERIQELTITDDCTGLYNVRHLYRTLQTEIDRSRRFQSQVSLIFIDLDHFKLVNDEHGHLIGSRLLTEVGQNIRSMIRGIDLAFRYGGDEFVILLPETRKDAAVETAMKVHHTLRTARFLGRDNLQLQVRASFGVATCPEDGGSVHEVIREADKMMYLVKGSTRDSIAVAGRGLISNQSV
jgi:diguanylate cyclase (GGDEF)-like protein